VYFGPIPPDVIDRLTCTDDLLECAGGFMIEHPLMAPYVGRIEGGEDSVRGLPLELTLKLVREVAA